MKNKLSESFELIKIIGDNAGSTFDFEITNRSCLCAEEVKEYTENLIKLGLITKSEGIDCTGRYMEYSRLTNYGTRLYRDIQENSIS